MYQLCMCLFVGLLVEKGSTSLAREVCGKDMLTAFLHQNKVTGYCLNTVRNIVEERKPVAFYAYMTAPFTTKGPGTKLIFDTVRTNVHNAYDKTTGVYTAPESGMYVFNWVIREYKSQHSVELMLNSEILGVTFKRAEGDDDASVSGTVVVSVRKGDSVFLRAHHKHDSKHKINNNIHGRSSFSGWRLCG